MWWCYGLVILVACAAPAHPSAANATDEIVAAALRDGGAVGLSIAIEHHGRVFARGYGLADREHHVAATEHSVYPLASISKQIWGIALMQLVDAHRVTLDTPVADVLVGYADRRTRVRDLMQHTAGLGDDSDDEDDVTYEDAVPTSAPGTVWNYSNRGAILVRRVVETVSGQPWPDYLRDHFHGPSVTTCGDHVPLYESSPSEAVMKRVEFVCADALDVLEVERALDAGTLIHADSLAAMRTPVRTEIGEIDYGLLTRIAELEGHRAYGHTGKFEGASLAAFRFPADDLTIVVLMNSNPKPGFRAPELVEQIARAELGLAALQPSPPSADVLAAVAGTYAVGGVVGTLSIRDGGAWLALPGWEGPLAYLGGRRFHGDPKSEDIVFVPAEGPVVGAMLGERFLLDAVAKRQ